MKIATVGKGPYLDVIKHLMKQKKVNFIDCKFNKGHLKDAKRLEDAYLIFLSLPPHEIQSCCLSIAPYITGRHAIVHSVHDLESQSHQTISTLLDEALPTLRFGFLSGPMRLEDIKKQYPASGICASPLTEVQEVVEECLVGPNFRLYHTKDLLGSEFASIYSRLIAFAMGIGWELGECVQALLYTRGLVESSRFVASQKGDARTSFGLAGNANLFLSTRGEGSLDFQLGTALVQHKKLPKKFLKLREELEANALSLMSLTSHKMEVDILKASLALLRGDLLPENAADQLMNLPRRTDF